MMFLAEMVAHIPVLEEKAFSMDCACPTMETIINSGIFLYGIECTIDLVLYLRVLMISPMFIRAHMLPVCVVWIALDLLLYY